MIKTFHAKTANDVWRQITEAFRTGSGEVVPSRCGEAREMLHVGLSVSMPRQRWMSSRIPSLNPAFAIAEVVWIMAGRNDSASLNYFNSQYPRYAGNGTTYHGAYGHRLRKHLGLDQLERAYLALRAKPESRQIVLQIWDSRTDFPGISGEPANTDIPCNLVSMLKIRSGLLEWMQVIRSNDLMLGLPHNLIQFTSLQEIMAGWLGIETGSYNQISDSLHLYEHDAKSLTQPFDCSNEDNVDDLRLPKNESELVFRELSAQMDRVTCNEVNSDALLDIARRSTLPTPYRNLLCILCAEGARRRTTIKIAQGILEDCRNPLLVRLFNGWCQRLAASRTTRENSSSSGA